MNTKLIGGILLIVGTAIGGGMLALPIAAAELGFLDSSLLLLGSWLIMTFSAFLILEVNLWLPPGSNLVTMAKATLGRSGQFVTWVIYLLLFYSLLAAYMAGGGDFLNGLANKFGLHTPQWLASLIFALVLSLIVYQGIYLVDYVNRGLMFSKLGIYILLVGLILVFVSPAFLAGGQLKYITTSFTVMLTSFGFANIVPSLRSYFHDDVKKLHKAILIGSLIPLVCYILWDMAIMGVIPRSGNQGLIAMFTSGHSTTELVNQISSTMNLELVTVFARIFTSICLATSFLGVSLALFDFIADSFKIPKKGKGNLIIYAITFLPPLVIVLLDPKIFIKALSYAGIYCMILLVLIPALMTWQGRYRKKLQGSYRVTGGKLLLGSIIAVAIVVIFASVVQAF